MGLLRLDQDENSQKLFYISRVHEEQLQQREILSEAFPDLTQLDYVAPQSHSLPPSRLRPLLQLSYPTPHLYTLDLYWLGHAHLV